MLSPFGSLISCGLGHQSLDCNNQFFITNDISLPFKRNAYKLQEKFLFTAREKCSECLLS